MLIFKDTLIELLKKWERFLIDSELNLNQKILNFILYVKQTW